MENKKPINTKVYFLAMAIFWLIFGLITAFYPALMNLFQTDTGISAITTYSDHIWQHDGFDIIAISVLLFALSRETASRNMLRAAGVVGLLATIAIISSLFTTPYWNKLFLVFSVWGFSLAGKTEIVNREA
jgi:hypothetical protein